jgi:electron-transferring-flavoprotein dehydrogenase
MMNNPANQTGVNRAVMDTDIVCVGFGPATAGFLYALTQECSAMLGGSESSGGDATCNVPQVICYERASDLSFGVSGVVTRGKGIKKSIPNIHELQIPMATRVRAERLVYLLDPIGASRRSKSLRMTDFILRQFKRLLGGENEAVTLPYIPGFLSKHEGLVFSIGQFCQWVSSQILERGLIQMWPGMPVARPLIERSWVKGVQLVDQGTDSQGKPADGFLPGMEVHAALTVVGDGPVGAIGEAINRSLGVPEHYSRTDWAVGVKAVIDLPSETSLVPGTVIHTFGYPEPEIFGFLYVHSDRSVSAGIFVPSWFENPVRTSYRYLQHWMLHPYLWQFLKGGRLRSWGAKSLQESGKRAEPHLVGDGYARIGEGSGTTNILTGSGVDEAWTSGVQLAEAVMELWREKKPFTKENLERTYLRRRRQSWLEEEAQIAERSRDGFHRGVLWGLMGMGLTGITKGRLNFPVKPGKPKPAKIIEDFFKGRISPAEIAQIRKACESQGIPLHDQLMEKCGWPAIPYDGELLVSHQDALLMGGKVQAPAGYADHVVFLYPSLCADCDAKVCVEICSGQAIRTGRDGKPIFEREKCVHCGACFWNCTQVDPQDQRRGILEFRAGPGGLHSAEN